MNTKRIALISIPIFCLLLIATGFSLANQIKYIDGKFMAENPLIIQSFVVCLLAIPTLFYWWVLLLDHRKDNLAVKKKEEEKGGLK